MYVFFFPVNAYFLGSKKVVFVMHTSRRRASICSHGDIYFILDPFLIYPVIMDSVLKYTSLDKETLLIRSKEKSVTDAV